MLLVESDSSVYKSTQYQLILLQNALKTEYQQLLNVLLSTIYNNL